MANTSVNIKMFKVGELGDCFLLTMKEGKTTKHMLIDCGSFRNGGKSKDNLINVASDIKKLVKKGKLNVVVATHQHNDHVNGFVHAESVFKQIGVEQVWLSWLDDPANKQAKKIGDNHIGLRKAMHAASEKMGVILKNKSARQRPLSATSKMTATKQIVDGLLDFYGAAPQLPAAGIANLKKIGSNPVEYLSPGETKQIPGIPQGSIKVHVLGPPKDETLLYRKDPKKGESYDHLKAMESMAKRFMSSLNNQDDSNDKEEEQYPFNMDYKRFIEKGKLSTDLSEIISNYKLPDNHWRNIDDDWLEQASRMALYMDTFTNNSSLVLAIELVKSGKVLLFAADAQIGNWISWWDIKFKDKKISIDNLLAQTVFYKVGHHGSHNSTLKDALEKMTSEELVVMIPVDKTDPNIAKPNGWKMPAKNLYKRLKEKTNYRILRMDMGFADECDPNKNQNAKASWKKVKFKPVVDTKNLYIEYEVS